VCLVLEIGLSVCDVCLTYVHVLIAFWVALSFMVGLMIVEG